MFNYIIEKIRDAEFTTAPFRHIYLEEVFSPEHFSTILNAEEINIPVQQSDSALFDTLFDRGYKIVNFPGCITSKEKYIAWHADQRRTTNIHDTCEGFGVTLRLEAPKSEFMTKLNDFLSSEDFNEVLAEKFRITLSETIMDNGIQKYLDGYEISPHPDNRKKALTFMVNINPHAGSENREHHTHYMTVKPEYKYVEKFWELNTDCETCWIPWDWCETVSLQTRNNSMVIFAPSFESLHGVRASYNHLEGQRTQLYGNLWHDKTEDLTRIEFEDLDVRAHQRNAKIKTPIKSRVAALLPRRSRRFLKELLNRNTKTVVKVRLKK